MKRYINFMFKMSIILLFMACENKSTFETNDGTSEQKSNVTGLVQKGTFIDGNMSVYKIEDNGGLTNLNVNATIDSNGSYGLTLKEDALVALHAKGNFFNEYTGENSTDEIELYALVDFKKSDVVQKINLNLFTSLKYRRVLTLMKEGKSYLEALDNTRNSMKQEFGLEKNIKITELNIYDLNGTLKDENLNLLLLSGAFLKSIDENSTSSKNSKTTQYQKEFSVDDFEEFLNRFEDDGMMDGDVWQRMRRYDIPELLNLMASFLGLEVDPPQDTLIWTDTPIVVVPDEDTSSFVMKWKTNESNEEISFSFDGTFDVDWTGDGTWDSIDATGRVTHVYPEAGTYVVKIHGKSPLHPRIGSSKLLSVNQWGEIKWSSMANAFSGCSQLKINATDSPDLSEVLSMYAMFSRTRINESLNHWDVSHVTDMSYLFEMNENFNQSLNDWNVSSVTTMKRMFGTSINFNQSIKDWDTSNVSDMSSMFQSAKSFNKPIGDWDVSNVTDMGAMFDGAESFNQPIGQWNTSHVINMQSLFHSAKAFNQPLENWDVSHVSTMNTMFALAKSFNQPLAKWDVGQVVDMVGLFQGAIVFNQPLGDWDISNVRNMDDMFKDVTFSIPNNDNILLKWSFAQLDYLPLSMSLPQGKYCLGKEAIDQILTDYHFDATGREGSEEECQAAYADFQIVSSDFIQVNENTSGILLIPELSTLYSHLTLIYSILDIDEDDFNIDTSTGALSFKNIPDYEQPTDKDKDNYYTVSIKASYGLVSAKQRIRVRVIDVNENTEPIVSNLLGDISNGMVTVFDRDVVVVEFDISDAQTPSNQLTIMSQQNPFFILEKAELDTDENTIGFFNYLSDNGLTFMCQDRSEPYSYLNNGKSYSEIVTLLSPVRDNCMKLETINNRTHVSLPISYYAFTEGNFVDSFYKKDKPFIYAIDVSDNEFTEVQKMVVLFRDKVRTNPLTESIDISFDATLNLYKVNPMKPTHMTWATRWSIEGKPSWAIFDTTTGELSGTATEDKVGNYDINITGYNSISQELIAKDTESFTLKLLPTDRVPTTFNLERRVGVAINTMTTVSMTISGLTQGATISLNGGDASYSINNATQTSADGIVNDGDKIVFFMNSSASYSTTRELTVTIGGVSSTWQVITRSAPGVVDRQPDGFQFTALNNVEFLTMQQASVEITGINADVQIGVTNGEYSFDNVTWTSTNGLLRADINFKGQIVYVRHLSGDEYSEDTRTKLTVANRLSTFVSTVKSSGDKATPPTLTPTQSTYVMDEEFTIDFSSNPLWRTRVTGVKLVGSLMIIQSGDGLDLLEGTDYTLTDNKLVIHSQALRTRLGNTYVREDYLGSWNVVIVARGYEDAYTMFEVQGEESLEITSPLNVTTPENQKNVLTVTASASPVTFSLEDNIDEYKFQINSTTGALSFRITPDFENPHDTDQNNVYVVVVKAIDNNGKEGYGTIMIEVTDVANDTPSPTPTVAPDLVDSNDTGESNSDNITNIAQDVNFDVVCPQKDATIRLYFNGNAYNNLHTCAGTGVERVIVPLFFDGISTMTYTQKISEQNVESAHSPSIELTIDTVNPLVLLGIDLATASDTGKSDTDDITSNKRPLFTVYCENNETIVKLWANYLRPNNIPGKITTDVSCQNTNPADRQTSGQFNEDFKNKEYQVTYIARDIAGNTALAPNPIDIVIDTIDPATPIITTPINGAVVSGTAEAATTLTAHTLTSSCSTSVDGSGNYACTLTPAPINGETVEVVAIDDAGNISPKATGTITGITTNHAPVITSGNKFTSYEHDDIIVVGANINATDPDGDLLTYSILPVNKGTSFDWERFTITASGILYFKQSPDYEFPLSHDSANYMATSYYDVCVKVEDDRGGEAVTCVEIDILNRSTDVAFSPQNHADSIAIDSNLNMIFTNPVKTLSKGSGNIKIFKKDGDVEHTNFSVSATQVEVSGNSIIINPNADFEPETEYYVIIDGGVLEDANGVKFRTIGIENQLSLDKDAWTFTTGKAPEPDNPCACPDFADCMGS